MSRKVLLHVGTPKTGTSYLQDVLFRNREVLAAAGIAYPADRHDSHFLAALDLMQLPWGGLQSDAIGAWDALARQVREALSAGAGTAVISHEILATASRAQIGRALESLGRDTEVHLVLSVRDLVRQIPAEWQENVKHRAQLSYGAFLDQIQDPERASRIGAWFWGVQEVPEILDRWGQELPPEQVHLVTVPPPGGAPSCSGRGSARPSVSTGSTSTSRGSGTTPPSAYPRPRSCAASTARRTPNWPRATTGPSFASSWRTRPSLGARARRDWPCRRTCTRGSRSCRRPGSPRSRPVGTT